jgi:hypothetical protein
LFPFTKKNNNSFQIAVLWCLNGPWKIKTSFRINPITDFIEMFTHVWEDNIKMDLREIRLKRVNWIVWHRIETNGVKVVYSPTDELYISLRKY